MDGNSMFVKANHRSRKQKSYWLEKLSKVNIKDVIPTKWTDPSGESLSTASSKIELQLSLHPTVSKKLTHISNQSDVTLFIMLLSGFIGFLHRYTDEEEIFITMPVYKELRNDHASNDFVIVGKQFDGEVSFRNLLLDMKEEFVQAVENQDYPLSEIFAALKVDATEAQNWLNGIVFASENIHSMKHVLGNDNNRFLALCNREDDRIVISFSFDRRSYDEVEIGQLIRCFHVFLEEVLADMSLLVSHVTIMTESEEAALLAAFNDTYLDYPAHQTIIQMFEQQVIKTPQRIAVVHQEWEMTYEGLNQLSNRLAWELRERGVDRETPVCIMLERGLEMVAAIIGILKSGGAYIPLDPNSPSNRLQYMVEESKPLLVITRQELAGKCPLSNVLLLETMMERDQQADCGNPDHRNEPTDLAYLLFTSGSTGKPKASMIEHRNVMNLVAGVHERVYQHYDEGLRIAVLAPFIFDMSVEQIFCSLLLGHTLYIVPEEARADGERLLEFFIHKQIDMTDGTPSHLVLLLEAMRHSTAELKMKRLIIGGESLPKETVERMYAQLGEHAPIITNSYGLTEVCVDTTYYDVTEQNMNLYHRIPIGSPLPNQQVYIVNKHNRLQPVGVVGELCIAGDNVGRGYLNRDELNANTFVDNPFCKGQKMYKTGDLAKWLPDGTVDCLGRKDTQIKIRGYRIELEEIENQLRKHPAVQDAKVLAIDAIHHQDQEAQERSGDSKQLAAYMVLNTVVDNGTLREFLIQELPAYMVPTYFVRLERMPLNQNDKVDRSKLPPIDLNTYDDGTDKSGPTNEREQQLTECWKQVLGRTSFGIKDNFFAIGGDSIKAIQMVSRMRQHQYKLEVRDVFKYPTIAQLANILTRSTRIPDQNEVTGEVPLTPIQRDFFDGCPADLHHYNQSVLLNVAEVFDEAALPFILTNLQNHHDALRIVFKTEGGQRIQFNRGQHTSICVEHIDLRAKDHAKQQLRDHMYNLQTSINLENGPLMKAAFFYTNEGNKLFLTIHHTVIDGVSWRILFEDMMTLYQQFKNGEKVSLPLKSDSFKFWAERLCEYADSEAMAKELPFWLEMESTMKAMMKINRDFPASYYIKDEDIVSFIFNETDTEMLLSHVHHAFYTEVNDVLLTALGRAAQSALGISSVAVELEGHGREQIVADMDISRTVGWFTSWHPFVVDISVSDQPAYQIKHVKETLRAVPNKGIGYGIIKHVAGDKSLRFEERPSISFNYLGQFDEDLNDTLFQIAEEAIEGNESTNRIRENDFAFNGAVVDGKLHMDLHYSSKQYKPETARALLDHYRDELLYLISFCASRTESEVTPSDLGYKELTMEQLDSFFD
ncbi:non-ribosomal peptide synthetase [Paenibacillus arenosi]|uniref:Amino acid adenylation domain-containing protein n=1 Tax=Paenibacillus arenosi TaxID=2774142 RepID=A0ABR9AVF3_9BACL|nr:non-ribosomal peptide synthetase [Paenibacillus arenosi]MBD8496926.1 amino acid adenylation domain-containing protein [Paenibacillus arenosi]